MYELVGERANDVFDTQVVDIAVFDHENGTMRFPYSVERGRRVPYDAAADHGLPQARPRDPAAAAHHRELRERRHASSGQPDQIKGEPALSAIFVPLLVGDEVLGVISLQNLDREHAFDERDVSLLTTLAASLSVALENGAPHRRDAEARWPSSPTHQQCRRDADDRGRAGALLADRRRKAR